jgi:hypothetical protein
MMVNATRQVSANYTISNEGRITLVVDEDRRAWTSGSSTDSGRGAEWDRRAITVEIENETAAPEWRISSNAVDAAARLLADLRTRYNITHVLGHRDLKAQYNASYATFCPGPDTVQNILNRETEIRGGSPAPVRPRPPVASSAGGSNPFGIGNTVGLQKVARLYGSNTALDNQFGSKSMFGFARFLRAKYGYVGNDVLGPVMWRSIARWVRARYGYVGNDVPGPIMRAALQRANDANMRAL